LQLLRVAATVNHAREVTTKHEKISKKCKVYVTDKFGIFLG